MVQSGNAALQPDFLQPSVLTRKPVTGYYGEGRAVHI